MFGYLCMFSAAQDEVRIRGWTLLLGILLLHYSNSCRRKDMIHLPACLDMKKKQMLTDSVLDRAYPMKQALETLSKKPCKLYKILRSRIVVVCASMLSENALGKFCWRKKCIGACMVPLSEFFLRV